MSSASAAQLSPFRRLSIRQASTCTAGTSLHIVSGRNRHSSGFTGSRPSIWATSDWHTTTSFSGWLSGGTLYTTTSVSLPQSSHFPPLLASNFSSIAAKIILFWRIEPIPCAGVVAEAQAGPFTTSKYDNYEKTYPPDNTLGHGFLKRL